MGCSKPQAAPPPHAAVPVVVGKVVQKTMPVQVTAVGNVEAISTISIRAQVPGELQEVRFNEGDFVRKGQVLVTIDPRPYQAALAQAQAALARDKAIAVNNRLQADRYVKLLKEGIMPASQVDALTSAADASDASLQADEAAIKSAELNVEYCTISSPVDGRTGTIMVKPGNLVKVADVPIVVINQVNPIYVNFTVPQQIWPDVKQSLADRAMRVLASVPQDQGAPLTGTLTFVDNAVDATTGSIHLRGTFENSENRLWPGLFVNVILTLSEQPNAIVVPSQAIVSTQQGSYVYVVKANNTVEQRTVVSDRSIQNEAIVSKGLQAGEVVVLDGQVNLLPGTKVEFKNDLNSSVRRDRSDRTAAPDLSALDRSEARNPSTDAR
ncbi:MAG: efflux RND transporter periplasmic adaptor subunit [Candidatus Acidiferrales bacterium]